MEWLLTTLDYLRQRAAFRAALQGQYRDNRTPSAWAGWKGRAKFPVRRPEDGEVRDDVEAEAFRVWFHATYRSPALAALRSGKRWRYNVEADEAWNGWRAQYLWQAAGQPIERLISGQDWIAIGLSVLAAIYLIFGHFD